MDLTAFYTTVTSISFTLLGLWLVVVAGRQAAWILIVEPPRETAA